MKLLVSDPWRMTFIARHIARTLKDKYGIVFSDREEYLEQLAEEVHRLLPNKRIGAA